MVSNKKRSLGKKAGASGIDESLAAINGVRVKMVAISETTKVLAEVEKKFREGDEHVQLSIHPLHWQTLVTLHLAQGAQNPY